MFVVYIFSCHVCIRGGQRGTWDNHFPLRQSLSLYWRPASPRSLCLSLHCASGTCDRSGFLHVLVCEPGSSCLHHKHSYQTISQVLFRIFVVCLYVCGCVWMPENNLWHFSPSTLGPRGQTLVIRHGDKLSHLATSALFLVKMCYVSPI